jgi:sugar phosphate isomerase/epimerase
MPVMQIGMCNEHLSGPPAAAFATLGAIGFDAVEVTPWTFTEDIERVGSVETDTIREAAAEAGLAVLGIPRVFQAGDEDYHIGQPPGPVRDRTVAALVATVECCAAIGGELVIFGSPDQRAVGDRDPEAVWAAAVETFAAPRLRASLERTEVSLCMEPLSPPHTDFITNADEAIRFIEAVDHPRVGLCLDGYHLAAETDPVVEVLERAAPYLRHFHADNTDGLGAAAGELDYAEVIGTLVALGYRGALSLEIHADILSAEPFGGNPIAIGRETVAHLRAAGANGSSPKN